MILGILNSKGGVGKSTFALLLAEALRREYGTVEVWDADPQGSAVDWAENAFEDDDPLSFTVTTVNKAQLRRRESDADYTIIDTPPGDPEAIDLAARRSDFLIIPTDSSPMDMKRSAATIQAFSIPSALLFYKVNPRTQLYATAQKWARDEDISFLNAIVPVREDVKKIVDTGIGYSDLFGVEAVASELIAALKGR